MISVGVDVSKGKSMVCFMKPYGEVLISPYNVQHCENDLMQLVEQIHRLNDEVRVVMESTGAYHYPILAFLKQHGVFVSVVNAYLMKKYAMIAIRKGKTDPLDAIKIASYGIDYWYKLVDFEPTLDVYQELTDLNRQYLGYLSMRIKAKVSMTNLTDRTMPGIKTVLWNRSDVPDRDKLCDFIREYWHYDNITCMPECDFIASYNAWAKEKGYHASTQKAKTIYTLALDGIPTMSSKTPSTKMLVLESVWVLQMIDKTLASILAQMRNLVSGLKEYEVVMAMPGVGNILGPRIIAEVGDVRRFHSGSALVAYAGLDAPPYQSGTFIGTNRHISKRGSSSLRKTGYEIIRFVKQAKPTTDTAVYDFLLKKEAEGKPLRVAKIAALNKFLRIYYARVKELYC
ncbi:transposase IS116/IS110/IS902 family protein [Hydrogenoanaerobacterium saccharovorans]|uniref:Transposase IS116/IS110/IS902 family protein n=1 Tax=Hydrogenoanaerobacterium saccharovorans TaxID=474960 RepID=A0A1H8BKE4_9FIRM|nr:IS110 family transposase [Hydrogenoanaerobacterium saccharovorans]RPF47360.1 transposase IS116/IS110/IS902 family protein [Hydrogenoanaerobacterium saccharovorans]SEM83335.1 Transposase IS116/IS110/IS902 family protein [Hydrogenoanaerobacterium saccharovorans]